MAGRLAGALERAVPHGEGRVADGVLDELRQCLGVLPAALREIGVAADLALDVELRLSVLWERGVSRSDRQQSSSARTRER